MRKIIMIAFLLFFSVSMPAQNEVVKAFSTGDATALSEYLAPKVDLSLLNSGKEYSRQQAISRLKDFFEQHAVKGFHQVHSGTSKNKESNYLIGQLATETGAFRVYLYFDNSTARRTISEIQIEALD